MRITTKIISVAASAALIAGAGAVAAVPAGAAGSHVHGKDTIKGSSTIGLPPTLIETLTAAGVSLNQTGGTLTVDGSTGYANITFPVTKPVEDGVINHSGVLEITGAATGVTLTLTDPVVTYASDGSATGALGGTLNGLPSWMEPFSSALNGTVRMPFDLTDLKLTVKTGKVAKKGKGFARADRVSATGMMSFTDSQESANIFNTALVGPTATPLFTPGQELGVVTTSFTVTHVCKTKAECKA